MNGNGNSEERMSDWNIKSITPMPKRSDLKSEIPLPLEVFNRVVKPARKGVCDILAGEDDRLIANVGPCSISSVLEALEYAHLLKGLIPKVPKLLVIMRACLDKPRTGVGWPGFFLDPDLDGSKNAHHGRQRGRKLLVDIVSMGVPVGLELLDANACQVVDECAAYWWIGARTVTSQRLREIASGLSTAVGFKNPTDGNIADAVEACDVARHEAAFIAMNHADIECLYRTRGNTFVHVIMRGSVKGPNFDPESVAQVVHMLAKRGLPTRILVDSSHANSVDPSNPGSGKDYRRQKDVIEDVVDRVIAGERHLAGFFYESYLEGGNQKIPLDLSELKPRVSITDGCDDWKTTEQTLFHINDKLSCFKPSPER
ncbi:MAG TPA: 3-deoxy-7-phosphoheptulonate synthase [Candidatus Paceibacterota bacterium]